MKQSTRKTLQHIPIVLGAVAEIRKTLAKSEMKKELAGRYDAAAGDANQALSSLFDRSLAKAGLRRQESLMTRTAKAAGWIGAGALVVGGAQLAWRLSPEDLNSMIKEATALAGRLTDNASAEIDMASHRAVTAASSAATNVADDVFGRLGYERQRSSSMKALSAAAWAAAGLIAGAAGAYMIRESDIQSDEERTSNDEHDASAKTVEVADDGVAAT